VALAAAAGALSIAPVVAQDTARPQFRSGVEVLQLDVSVLDKNRRPVEGLTLADFTVEIGGKPAPIVAFAPVTLPAVVPPAAAWMKHVAPDTVSNQLAEEGRLIVLLFESSLVFEQMTSARRIARMMVETMAPGDLAAATYVGQAAPHNFTADRSRLLTTIDQPFLGGPGGELSTRGECFCGTCSLEAIEHVANSLRPVERRRKLLIFIGSMIEFQSPRWEDARCFVPLKDARTQMFRALDLANVVVHSLDPTSLTTGGTPASSRTGLGPRGGGESGRQLNLGVLPARTGGRVVVNTDAPEEEVAAVLSESASYYVLGVERPAPRSSGRDQQIEIEVNRKGVTVSSSRAYHPVAPSSTRPDAPTSPNGPPRALVDALAGVWPATAVDLSMTASAFDVPGQERSTVAIITTVTEPRTAAELVGGYPKARTFNVLAGAWDRNGRPTATQTRTVEVLTAPGPSADRGRVFQIASRLELPRGKHDVRVAVEDAATGRRGSVYTTVEIPNFAGDDLALSAVVVGATPDAPLVPQDTFSDLLPIVPSAAREFTRASRVGALVRVYQGGRDSPRDVAMKARLVNVASTAIVDETSTMQAARFTAQRSADYIIELPVATLPAGPYLLTLTAALGDKAVERHLRFEMK
jgi:VWFA-related protein